MTLAIDITDVRVLVTKHIVNSSQGEHTFHSKKHLIMHQKI